MTTPPYGTPQPGGQPQSHPKAVLALVLAIVSWFVCGLILSIPAYIIAKNAEQDVRASNGTIGGGDLLKAARIIALINIIVSVVAILILIVMVLVMAVASTA